MLQKNIQCILLGKEIKRTPVEKNSSQQNRRAQTDMDAQDPGEVYYAPKKHQCFLTIFYQ